MLFADVTIPDSVAFSILGLFGMLMSAIGVVFRLLMSAQSNAIDAKDAFAKNLQGQLASRTEMAHEAISDMEVIAAKNLADKGKPVVVPLVPVVPEHNSPTTEEQRLEAEAQTLRARLVAAKLALDLPARQPAVMELPEDAALRKGIPFDPATAPTDEEEKANSETNQARTLAATNAIALAQDQAKNDQEPIRVTVVPPQPPEPFH